MPPYPKKAQEKGIEGGEGRTRKRKGGGGEGKDGMGKEGQEKRGKGRAGTWKKREFGGGGKYASWPLGGDGRPCILFHWRSLNFIQVLIQLAVNNLCYIYRS
jgi:hypothetical protein